MTPKQRYAKRCFGHVQSLSTQLYDGNKGWVSIGHRLKRMSPAYRKRYNDLVAIQNHLLRGFKSDRPLVVFGMIRYHD